MRRVLGLSVGEDNERGSGGGRSQKGLETTQGRIEGAGALASKDKRA